MRLLIVCTANRCRSPLGEAIAVRQLAAGRILGTVVSAGTEATDGAPATDGAIATARRLGLDLSGHASRPVTEELVAAADIVLAMEPRHVIEVVREHGGALASTFTVPELAGLVTSAAERSRGESIAAWLDRVAAGRTAITALAAPTIDDPIGRPMRHYRAAARSIEVALARILDRSGSRNADA